MNFDMVHAKVGQQHDQLKSFCMDFVSSALTTPGGPEFFEELRLYICDKCEDENLSNDPLETTMARFAYLGMMAILDGLGQRLRDKDDLE